MSKPFQQQTKLSWVERYRPERLFYLLLVSLILSVPANLLQSLIVQGPDSLPLSQWAQLYIIRMAVAYPLPAAVIGLLAIGLAIYGFRLDQRHQKMIAEKEKQARLKEAEGQFQPVHELVQGVADRQKTQGEGIEQVIEQTAQIQHLMTHTTVPLIPVREIKPETLNLGDDQSATFPYLSTVHPEVYEQATRIFRAALADAHQRGLLVTGAPMAGKTRLAYQAMQEYAPDWLTLTWTRGLSASAIPAPQKLAGQRMILFLDDLQQYAESERSGDELAGTSNDVPLDRLYVTLMQSAVQVVIVATCRATDLSRAETTSSLRWLFEKVQVVALPFIPDEQQGAVIGLLKATKATMDYHTDDFDGTMGSLLLGLSRKREQYLELKKQRHPGYLVLRAMKVLNVAGIAMQTRQRVRAMAVQTLGARMLSDEFTWSTTCEALEERQFLTQQDTVLVLRKDVYFDKVITDYPTQVRDALLQARRVFHAEGDSEALIAVGWVHSERKEFTEMLETGTMAVELAPGHSRAHYAQGAALGYLLRNEEALACFDKALDLDPGFAVGWNNKAYMLDALQRYEEALVAYDEAIKLNPHYARAWYNKGITLLNLRRNEEALAAYEEAIKLNPQFADAWYNKGVVLSRLRQNEEAQAAFEAALAATTVDPTIASGWNNKGDMLIALQRNEEALAVYDEAIKLNPHYAEVWGKKGIALWNLDRCEEALVCFDKALVINPQYADVWMNKGDLLYDLERYEEAFVCYDKVSTINPQNAVAWSSKGAALSWLKRNGEALMCCDKALAIDPQFSGAWSTKGYILNDLKRYEETLVCCDKALAIDPQSPNPWRHKGNALRGLHRDEEALVCFDKALTINPQYVGAWYNKGAVLRQLERDEEALAAYDKAVDFDKEIKLNPEYVQCYEEALVAYDQAIKLNPQNDDAWDNKGKLLYKLGRSEEARATYEQAIQLNPHYTELFEEALASCDEATKLNPQNYDGWYMKGVALCRLGREAEAQAAFDKASKLKSQNKHAGGWSTPGFGKYLSPDLVGDEYLDDEVVVMLRGTNLYGTPVYSYLKLIGSSLKKLFAKMQAGENFKPSDFGTILASGTGEPSQEIREEMKEKYDMIDVPITGSVPAMQPKSFDDESK